MTSTDTLAASALLRSLPDRQGFGDASLIKLSPGSIDLGGGNPDPAVLPVELYRDAVLDLTEDPATFAPSLRYVPAPGIPSLRAALAEREGVAVERILVTAGATHGLALSVLGTLDAGDTIVVDDPVYPLFLRILDLVDVRLAPIPVQHDGLDVEELERQLSAGLRPKALFTVPTFHNPTGVTLSEEKATRLVELAERYGFTIISDDPYKDVGFSDARIPDRTRFAESDSVIQVNTFSKTLGPALRLGWNVVPGALSGQYTKLRNRLDGQTSGVLQEIVVRMLAREEYAPRIAAAGAHYATKARVLIDALEELLPGELDLEVPEGGFFLWGRFRDRDADFARHFDLAQERGVTYQRGEWFEVDATSDARGAFRLSFSEPDAAALRTGAERFAAAWRELRA